MKVYSPEVFFLNQVYFFHKGQSCYSHYYKEIIDWTVDMVEVNFVFYFKL